MKNFTKSSVKAGSKPIFILDSSVAIKWFTKEETFFVQAQKILEDYLMGKIEIYVPDIFWWELGNYLGREADLATATVIYLNIKKYHITTYMLTDALSVQSLIIMKSTNGISFYDASYHSLALQMKTIFITSDEKYYKKAKKFGRIKLLKDYK